LAKDGRRKVGQKGALTSPPRSGGPAGAPVENKEREGGASIHFSCNFKGRYINPLDEGEVKTELVINEKGRDTGKKGATGRAPSSFN